MALLSLNTLPQLRHAKQRLALLACVKVGDEEGCRHRARGEMACGALALYEAPLVWCTTNNDCPWHSLWASQPWAQHTGEDHNAWRAPEHTGKHRNTLASIITHWRAPQHTGEHHASPGCGAQRCWQQPRPSWSLGPRRQGSPANERQGIRGCCVSPASRKKVGGCTHGIVVGCSKGPGLRTHTWQPLRPLPPAPGSGTHAWLPAGSSAQRSAVGR